ncbi:hypothetical protein PHACT_13615 [Pseudohongiella acticola]|uniref:CDP-alcohol phosphatidyltransferase n=1 Tax=Pseudohongiella acticola TaxID=1524254 RepID=A0A1E8CGP5_9GAMM|nr:CDP-alcohol phosphatidyltransferase family protein [Pseudohongiella acticola]OFE11572.1 hypothetical protein PHACT_13615 [Pseudohongiella acticola]
MTNESQTYRTLQTELRRAALSGFVGFLLCASLLFITTTAENTLLYLSASVMLWLLAWHQSNKRLHLNRANTSAALQSDLGPANCMTLSRGWLIAATGGFLLIPDVLATHPVLLWIAAALYSVAAIFDRVDGYLARRSQRTSLLGAELDTVFDALGLLIAPVLALQHGKIHASYLLVSVAYYLFVVGIKVRERNHKPVYALPPSVLRRTLAGFQMGYVAVVLWPPFRAEITVLAGFGFMVPLLIGFTVDWLLVSGRLQRRPQRYAMLQQVTHNALLPVLRLMLPLSAWLIVSDGFPVTPALFMPITGLFIIGVSLMLLGLAGRAGAVAVLMLLAWTGPAPDDSIAAVFCLFASITILLLGCGRFSAWQADDDWVNRQDGA